MESRENYRVLVVDDVELNREFLVHYLDKLGYLTSSVEDGEKCLAKVAFEKPDVILLDLVMPKLDGYETLARLKEDDDTKSIPVIMVSAHKEVDKIAKCIICGAEDYLIKPFEPKILEARLKATIQKNIARNKEVEFLKYYDNFTGLPNKEQIFSILSGKIERLDKNNGKIFASMLYIYNLKEVNGSYGFESGNKLIALFAKRILSKLANDEELGRVGDNQFLLISECGSFEEHNKKIQSILDECTQRPYLIGNDEIFITVKIGVSVYPDDALTVEDLIKASSLAIHCVDKTNSFLPFYYSDKLSKDIYKKTETIYQLRKAIEKGELSLLYQPKVDAITNNIVGSEALMRWNNEKLGAVSPAVFIPLAEEANLINDISKWLMNKVAKQINHWKKVNKVIYPVSINLSPDDFIKEDFIDDFKDYISAHNLSGNDLQLELTEGAFIYDLESIINKIDQVKRLGFKIHIDDFGIGYSSLTYLKRLNVDVLKLDRSFIKDFPEKDDGTIAKVIVNLAKSLNKEIIAEGVETKEQVEYLVSLGCKFFQGYYYFMPLISEEFGIMQIRQKKSLL